MDDPAHAQGGAAPPSEISSTVRPPPVFVPTTVTPSPISTSPESAELSSDTSCKTKLCNAVGNVDVPESSTDDVSIGSSTTPYSTSNTPFTLNMAPPLSPYDSYIALRADFKPLPKSVVQKQQEAAASARAQRGRKRIAPFQPVAEKMIRERGPHIRKRAVVIGLSYCNTDSEREAPINTLSARRWHDTLIRRLQYLAEEVILLVDDNVLITGVTPVAKPTRNTIIDSLKWLVGGATENHRLFLSINGNVAIEKDAQVDSTHPAKHGLIPCNYPSSDPVWDHEIHDIIKSLHPKSHLTIFLDSRVSWNLIRLPHVSYLYKHGRHEKVEMQQALTSEPYSVPRMSTTLVNYMMDLTSDKGPKEEEEKNRQIAYFENMKEQFENSGTVVCFAASPARYRRVKRHKHFGINWLHKGMYTAMAQCTIEEMWKEKEQITYRSMMEGLADKAAPDGMLAQMPQICCTKDIDLDQVMAT